MNRKNLVDALKTIIDATDKNDSIAVSDSFVFDNNKVYVYSGNMFFVYPIDINIKCVVRAKETLKILDKMDSDEVDIIEKNGSIHFSSGKTKLKMNNVISDDAGLNIPINIPDDSLFQKVNNDFFSGVELCFHSLDKNSQVNYLNGIFINKDTMWSSDDLKISKFSLSNDYGFSATIPYKACVIVKNTKNQPETIAFDNNWLYFKYDSGVVFATSTILDKFPIDRASEIINEYVNSDDYYEFPEDITKSIDRVSVFANMKEDEDTPKISISRRNNTLIVRGEKRYGSVEDTIELEDNPMFEENIVLRINPDLLKKILNVTKCFTISDGVAAFKMDNFVYIMSVSYE